MLRWRLPIHPQAGGRRSPEPFMGLTGPDRAMLYIVAANTGLRASELASLTPESFELNCEMPTVRCLGGYTKNGEEAVLPLRPDVTAMLHEWLADRPTYRRLWDGDWASRRRGSTMIRVDLTAADIDYEDASGRVADFHALRHTFIPACPPARQAGPTSPAPACTPATPRPSPATARST